MHFETPFESNCQKEKKKQLKEWRGRESSDEDFESNILLYGPCECIPGWNLV